MTGDASFVKINKIDEISVKESACNLECLKKMLQFSFVPLIQK